jgi:hypothetical protein
VSGAGVGPWPVGATGTAFAPDAEPFVGFDGANPLKRVHSSGQPASSLSCNAFHAQCDRHCLGFGFFQLAYLLSPILFALLLITIVPVHVLVLLPSPSRRVYTVTEVVLYMHECNQCRAALVIRARRASLSLSAETSVHLNSACPPLVPPRVGSNMVMDAASRVRLGASTATRISMAVQPCSSCAAEIL